MHAQRSSFPAPSRREFIKQSITAAMGLTASSSLALASNSAPQFPIFQPGEYQKINSPTRRFHLSVTFEEVLADGLTENDHPMPPNPDAVKMNAARNIELWKEAGVTDLWLLPYEAGLYIDQGTVDATVRQALDAGYKVHFITVPVGHPNSKFPAEVEARWKPYAHFNGQTMRGVSVHEACAQDCVKSVRKIADRYGQCDVFLDDDFRFAIQPDTVGGCVCDECKADFMRKAGFTAARWDALMDDLRSARDAKDARLWLDYFCDRMTKTFRDTQKASPEVDLGIMIMGMGSEKAGIRLDDYRSALLRVGEWMFTDAQYDHIKNKTIELFSVLFHRRFVPAGRAFSETTIIQELSAENYVSKLSIATLGDVRNTMFMCPIPASYWGLIAPRMKREAEYHSRLLNATPKGPFKHFWGLADRYCAGYNAYSLFLATGTPFEVCDAIPEDGWTFLADYSAMEMERGELKSGGSKCVARLSSQNGKFVQVPESFEELFAFRRQLLPEFRATGVPYVEEEHPVVLRWYPDAKAYYLWNIEKVDRTFTLCVGDRTVVVPLKALDSALVLEDGEGFRTI